MSSLAALNSAVRALLALEVARMREQGVPVGEDEYRGLYVSEREADRLAAPPAIDAAAWQERRAEIAEALDAAFLESPAAAALAGVPGLGRFERGVLALCLAAELDLGLERLVSFVQDDISRKRPRGEMALRLLARPGEHSSLRAAFGQDGPLLRLRLVTLLEEPGSGATPLVARGIALDARIANHLAGVEELDARLAPHASKLGEDFDGELPAAVMALADLPATRLNPPVAAVHGPDPLLRRSAAARLAAGANVGLIEIRLAPLAAEVGFEAALTLALREGLLQGAAVLLDGVDQLAAADAAGLRARLRGDVLAPLAVLGSAGPFAWPGAVMHVPAPGYDARVSLWSELLKGTDVSREEIESLAGKFRLGTREVGDAVRAAEGLARVRAPRAPSVGTEDLYAAAREQSAPILSDLARKIPAHYAWDDLILPADTREQLREMVAHVEHRHLVYERWGFERKLAMGKGLIALFAGQSGTGKTMAADVLAGSLGLDLYKIDLSGVVSKYIGETEKNLGAIFRDAEASNAILFFDEADALFGKRSEVKDAHDRYANIETAYLLQRMEEYSGVVILATNLKMNLDEAFLRRMHFVCDFPLPEEDDRRRIWEVTVPADAPLGDDVDFAFLARQFKIAGGNIRNIVLAAAFFAASEGSDIRMAHFIRGVRREYQKLGRMVTDAEFGPYVKLLR